MIEIYTDGSCHTQLCIGGWAAILFIDGEKIVLSGKETDTSHNRMELTAVIKAIEYIVETKPTAKDITIVSDSQYVIGLTGREEKFKAHNYTTKKGKEIRNAYLVKELLAYASRIAIHFVKIKAHQKKTADANYNIEVDKLSRNIVRKAVCS